MKELIEKIYQLQTNKENLETQKNEIQENIDALDAELEASKAELLKQMQSDGVNTFTVDDIKAGTFHRKDIAWLDDKALLEYLTSTKQEQYINTKVTKSVAKAALKKAMKKSERSSNQAIRRFLASCVKLLRVMLLISSIKRSLLAATSIMIIYLPQYV